MSKPTVLERLKASPVVLLDGATGTELARRGFDVDQPGWSAMAIRGCPDLLCSIHQDYVNAGAEVITANTFRTHRRNLEPLGLAAEARDLTLEAVALAHHACGEKAWVAGSVAPLGDCYSPDQTPDQDELIAAHSEIVEHLADAGVDLILIETQTNILEASVACQAASQVNIPYVVSFVTDVSGRLLSGERLTDAVQRVCEFDPAAIMLNCVSPFIKPSVLKELANTSGKPVGIYANTGTLNFEGTWEETGAACPAVYAGFAEGWMNAGIRLIGGCCGTTPEHISALKLML